MKEKYRRLETTFGPETRFELRLVSLAPFRAVFEDHFDRLKARLLAESLEMVWEPRLSSEMRRAANEAAVLAQLTPYPSLFFPVLFEEKAAESLRRAVKQKCEPERNCHLIAL